MDVIYFMYVHFYSIAYQTLIGLLSVVFVMGHLSLWDSVNAFDAHKQKASCFSSEEWTEVCRPTSNLYRPPQTASWRAS